VADPREGVWLGAGEIFVHQALDRWSVFQAPAAVNRLATDGTALWVATDDGALKLDTGSRRAVRFGMEEGLPSQSVTAVAADDSYVWFATNKGVARYRKLDRTVRVFTDADGLPHRAVNDILVAGRLVWFATRGGIAYYDPDLDALRAFTAADGLAGENVAELFAVGDDVWCRTDVGLSRLRVKARRFANFGFREIGGAEIRFFTQDGDRVWVGTENGLVSFEPTSDTFVPFPQRAALEGRAMVGLEPFTDYLFITTDREVVQFHKTRRTIRRFTEADGLMRRAGARGTVLQGGQLVLLFADGAEVYDIQRDRWSSRTLAVTEGGKQSSGYRLWSKLNASTPYDFRAHSFSPDRYATAEGGGGLGQSFGNGRSLDANFRLDYGQLEMSGIRDVEANFEYLGNDRDLVREVRAGDKLSYRTVEEGLERPFPLMGGHVRLASPGAEPTAQATVDAGQRRGLSARDFFYRSRQDVYQLSHKYVLPGSERVTVDGELLVSGVDYTVIYSAGQLAFLDPERVDDLSIISVDYEYDLLAKKGLGVMSLLDFLPADREVGDWVRSSDPRLVSEESGLYAQIDGAAPKYIDRGWVRSVFAEYRQGSRSLQVAVHDMGTPAQAQAIFSYDLPAAREIVSGHDNVVIDIGLASSYAVKAFSGSDYFELSIDEKSDAAKQTLKLFALQILDRAESAGENRVPSPQPLFAAARVAATPVSGFEMGARAVRQSPGPLESANAGVKTPGLYGGGLDARLERPVGEGRITAYAEALGTQATDAGSRPGMGAMTRLRLSHPFLEGVATGRWLSPGYLPLTSNKAFAGYDVTTGKTLTGTLRHEESLQATAYPARWLPATIFVSRQASAADQGGEGTVQQVMGRLQLNRDGLPATSIQLGHTLLDGPTASHTSRLRFVAQTEYDLAQWPLAGLGVRRFDLRALYGISDATTDQAQVFARADRAEQMRFEARLAPTSVETLYALYRSRTSTFQLAGGSWSTGIQHWELNAGARTERVRGIVPILNYSVIDDDDHVTSTTPVRSVKGSLGLELQVFPGQWLPVLTPVLLDTRYSVAADDRTEGGLRTLLQRTHRIDNRFIYAGAEKWELELYQVYEVPLSGPDQQRTGRRIELGNRVTYRPIFASPITLRLDYTALETPNDTTAVPTAPLLGSQTTYEGALEWLMRWTRAFSTKLKATYSHGMTRDSAPTGSTEVKSFTQDRAGPDLELRYLLSGTDRSLYLVQHSDYYRLFGDGNGYSAGAGFDVSLGVIWTVGDNVYLDSEIAYQRLNCFNQTCSPVSTIAPRLLLSARL
jgi:hypothetical protein